MALQNMDYAAFIEFRSVSLLAYKGHIKESDTSLYEMSESSVVSLVCLFFAGQISLTGYDCVHLIHFLKKCSNVFS